MLYVHKMHTLFYGEFSHSGARLAIKSTRTTGRHPRGIHYLFIIKHPNGRTGHPHASTAYRPDYQTPSVSVRTCIQTLSKYKKIP